MTGAGQCEKQKACEGTHDGLAAVTISRLKARLEELEQKSTSFVADKHELSARVACLQQSCNEGIAQLSQAKLAYKQQETALQDEVQVLKNQLADARAASNESLHQVEAARAEVHDLLAAREGGSQKLRAQVAQLQTQLTAKTSEAATLSCKLAALEPLSDALESELRSLHQSLAKVTSRVHAQEAALKHHEKRLLETTRAGEKLADQLEAKEAALQAAQQQLQDMKASSTAAEQAHQAAQHTLQDQLSAAQQQIKAMSADHAACQAELNGRLQGMSDNVRELQAQAQESAAYQQTAAADYAELKSKLAAAEAAAAAASLDATEPCNTAVLAAVVLQQAHAKLHTSASVIIQAEKHAAAAAREAAGSASAEVTAAKAAAEAWQLAAEEATAAAEAAEAKASAADTAAAAAKADAATAESRAATAEADAAAATARFAAAEAAAAAAAAQVVVAEQDLAAVKAAATSVATAHARALVLQQQQQSNAQVDGAAHEFSAVAMSAAKPSGNMVTEPAPVVKQETTVSPPPSTAAAAAAAAAAGNAQPSVLAGTGQPGMLSGSKRTSPESAGTAETQLPHAARQCIVQANKQLAVTNTLAAQQHHHRHHYQQQHGSAGFAQQQGLQQLQQSSGPGAAVSATNLLNPLTQPRGKWHNVPSHAFLQGNSASCSGTNWPTQQGRTHATVGASNQGTAPATFMPAWQALPKQQHVSYSQQQQQSISCSQQQLHAGQEPCNPHLPQQQQEKQQQQQHRPYMSPQQQQHGATQEQLNQQQRRWQQRSAWPQVSQLPHAPVLAAGFLGSTGHLARDALTFATSSAPACNNLQQAAEQQGSAHQINTALPGPTVSKSKLAAEAGTTVARCTGVCTTVVEHSCNGAMTAAASTTQQQSEQQQSTEAVSNDSPVTAAAAPAASVAADATVGTGKDAITAAAAGCKAAADRCKPSHDVACTIVKVKQGEKAGQVGDFMPPAFTAATVKSATELAVIGTEPALMPAGDQKAASDQQQSAAAAVAEVAQQQQQPQHKGLNKAAKPATAMGMLFCALVDSEDDSE